MGALRRKLTRAGLPGLLVTHLPDLRYLSGFTGSSAALAVARRRARLFTDSRYATQAGEEVEAAEVEIVKGSPAVAAAQCLAAQPGVTMAGFDPARTTVAELKRWKAELPSRLRRSFFEEVPAPFVERLRMVKDEDELAVMAEAALAGCQLFEGILEFLRPGIAEINNTLWHRSAYCSTSDGEIATRVLRFESGELSFDARAVGATHKAGVNLGPGVSGNDIRFCAAAGDAHADGEAALEIGPAADLLDDAGEFADGVRAFFKVDSGVSGNARDVDAPIANSLAGRFVGQALRRLEDVDGGAGLGDFFGDGAGGRAANLLVAVEKEHDFSLKQARFSEQLEGGERHSDTGLHVEGTGAPKAATTDPAGHGLKRAERPNCVEVTEEEDRL